MNKASLNYEVWLVKYCFLEKIKEQQKKLAFSPQSSRKENMNH